MLEEPGAVLLPGIDSTGVVSVDAACVAVRAWVGAALDGPSAWSQLIDLISDEADIISTLRGLELIYVPYKDTCGPAERKDHAWEMVSSSDLESPLVHECL